MKRSTLTDLMKGGGGLLKLIGNTVENSVVKVSDADASMFVLANNPDGVTFWSVRVSKDMKITWQRKHTLIAMWTIIGYAASAVHTFMVWASSEQDYLFIQSAGDGSTTRADIITQDEPLDPVRPSSAVRGSGDTIVASGKLYNVIEPSQNAIHIAEISATPSIVNAFGIGKTGVSISGVIDLVDGSDVYIGAFTSSVRTVIKASLSGTIAWQKLVGTSSPPVVAANAASSLVYLAQGADIIALSSVDGSFVWGKTIVKVKQVSTITIGTFDAATTYSVLIGIEPITQVGTTDANTTATNLKNALAASADTDYSQRTWTVAANVVTGTANVAGTGFAMTTSVSGGTGTISNATPTPNNSGVSVALEYVADDTGIFASYSSDVGNVLIKLSAKDGSELFAKRISEVNSLYPALLAGSGPDQQMLLHGRTIDLEPQTFGPEGDTDIIVGACASSQATDFVTVYQDITPNVTNGTYYSVEQAGRWSFLPDTFNNQGGDLNIKDFIDDGFPS